MYVQYAFQDGEIDDYIMYGGSIRPNGEEKAGFPER